MAKKKKSSKKTVKKAAKKTVKKTTKKTVKKTVKKTAKKTKAKAKAKTRTKAKATKSPGIGARISDAYHAVVDSVKGTDTLRNKMEKPGTSESQ